MELCVVADEQELAIEGASQVMACAARALAERGEFRIALTGGSTPKVLYERLAECGDDTDFERWQIFIGDERMVPREHADSNFRMAWQAWLHKVPIPARNLHRVRTELGDAKRVATDYSEQLRRVFALQPGPLASGAFPQFDLILLGLGEDGHVASLFPHTEAMNEAHELVVANWVPRLDAWRVTFTFPLIRAAREVLFLVSGAQKADAVGKILAPQGDPALLPARAVELEQGTLTWLVDRAAARDLER